MTNDGPAGTMFFPAIQDLRGYAALMVVAYHAHVLMAKGKYFDTDILGGLFAFGYRGVDLFFVISGFLMAMLATRARGFPGARRFAADRARRIFVPYLPVAAALTGVCMVLPAVCPAAYRFDPLLLLQNALLLPRRNLDTYVPVVAWTLSHELFFYLMTFASLLMKRWGGLFLASWLGVSLLVQVAGAPLAFPWSFLLSHYNLAFGLGILVFHARRLPWVERAGAWPGRLGLLAFLGLGLWESFRGLPSTEGGRVAFALAFFAAAASMVHAAVRARRGFAQVLGNASYSVYLVHYPVLVVLAMLASRDLAGSMAPEAVFAGMVVLGTAAGLAYYALVERPGLLLLRGRRVPSLAPGQAA